VSGPDEERFLGIVLADPLVRAVVDRSARLGVDDWWLAAGALFQAVWNRLTGRPPGTGVRDADLLYFDPDTSWDAEDAVIGRGEEVFAGLPVPVEIRNQARVHLWFAGHFGVPAPPPHRGSAEAIDGFAAVCCCYGLTVDAGGRPRVHAPYGYADLFDLVVRPNGRRATREAYEAKAARWVSVWPELTVLPYDGTA
jgi:hypothetical protein